MLEARVHVPAHVVYRWFDAETVLLNLRTGQYHGLNQTGGRMLELLQETEGTVRDAIERLAAEYGEDPPDIEDGLASFCAALAARGLIEIDANGDA
jgi:PqqD family protein of HPr-rel-A system